MGSERIPSVISDLEAISAEVQEAFSNLTVSQLNWKPDEKNWSVAQCLEHLIVINSLYFPVFESLRVPNVTRTFLEKYSPFSGFFGRFLITRLGPESLKKMKTSKKAFPSASEIGGDIVDRFVRHNGELAGHVERLPEGMDLKTIITSPLARLVTYSLDDCLTILVVHERRHVLQAKRVMSDLGFGNADLGFS
jgi:hypothetical protein